MIISERKNFERKKFKILRDKSTLKDRENVILNVQLFIETTLEKEKRDKYIGIYWPIKNEIDIRDLKKKYKLALPRCEKNKKLSFGLWDERPLTKDLEGIPAPEISNSLSYAQISIIFIPCLSIDKSLIRLGYGGGYFDKLRQDKNWRAIPFIGVLTSNCVSKKLLTKAVWDIPLSGYITENEILV